MEIGITNRGTGQLEVSFAQRLGKD